MQNNLHLKGLGQQNDDHSVLTGQGADVHINQLCQELEFSHKINCTMTMFILRTFVMNRRCLMQLRQPFLGILPKHLAGAVCVSPSASTTCFNRSDKTRFFFCSTWCHYTITREISQNWQKNKKLRTYKTHVNWLYVVRVDLVRISHYSFLPTWLRIVDLEGDSTCNIYPALLFQSKYFSSTIFLAGFA